MTDVLYLIDLLTFALATALMFVGLAAFAAIALMFFAGYWRP